MLNHLSNTGHSSVALYYVSAVTANSRHTMSACYPHRGAILSMPFAVAFTVACFGVSPVPAIGKTHPTFTDLSRRYGTLRPRPLLRSGKHVSLSQTRADDGVWTANIHSPTAQMSEKLRILRCNASLSISLFQRSAFSHPCDERELYQCEPERTDTSARSFASNESMCSVDPSVEHGQAMVHVACTA